MKSLALRVAVASIALLPALANTQPPAWRVTAPNGISINLLGSIHYLRADDYPLPDSVDQLYQAADTLIMELDLDDLDPLQMSQDLVSRGTVTDGKSLDERLPAATLRGAQDAALALGIPLETLSRFEPWLIALTLTQLKMSQLGFDPNAGLEQHLLGRARADRKQILGLETVDDQLAVFDSLSESQQAAFLEQTVAEMAGLATEAGTLVDAWLSGDVELLAADLLAGLSEFPELYRLLVVERNLSWADQLTALSKNADGHHLVVVGTLHLVGEDSLVALMAKRGFAITRLKER